MFFADGQMFAESQSVDVEHDPQMQPVYTQQKGFAGMTPGAEVTKFTVDSAVPASGYEYDYLDKLQNVTVVEATLFAASKKLTVKGYITNLKKKFAWNNPATVTFDFMGGPAKESTLLASAEG